MGCGWGIYLLGFIVGVGAGGARSSFEPLPSERLTYPSLSRVPTVSNETSGTFPGKKVVSTSSQQCSNIDAADRDLSPLPPNGSKEFAPWCSTKDKPHSSRCFKKFQLFYLRRED